MPCVDYFAPFTSTLDTDIVISDDKQLTFAFRTRHHLILLRVAPVVLLKERLTAARDALAPHPDLLVDSNMARPVVSMELPVVHLDLRVDPQHLNRSMPIVAC